jgi:lipopolysaccharide/colanic/teichoic acid biosynthesis glycosyltransferase
MIAGSEETMEHESDVNNITGNTLVFPAARSLNRMFYYFSKRLIDILAASIALVLLSPIMLLIAILVRLDSPGPALFIQKRIYGKREILNGKMVWKHVLFPCYKFRSMVQEADPTIHKEYIKTLIENSSSNQTHSENEAEGIKKLTADARVTRLGHILRRSSLDELPQFWNILVGNMSLVGPRPAIPYELEMYKPWYHRRLDAKPGLTGLWQVSGRSTLGFDEMMKLDVKYVEQQSLKLDLIIMLKTPLVILSRRGAL